MHSNHVHAAIGGCGHRPLVGVLSLSNDAHGVAMHTVPFAVFQQELSACRGLLL